MSHIILRSFTRNRNYVCTTAFKIYVRPLLEYNTQIWNVGNKGETKRIEQIQRMFTRKLLQRTNTKYNDYNHRLEILGMQRLELRRLHRDLITLYKIIQNQIDLSFENLFELKENTYNLRRHTMNLKTPPVAQTGLMKNSFKYRVIEAWNYLPNEIVTSKTIAMFKKRFEQHFT